LGRLEERRDNPAAARMAYERALDLLPSYMEAALPLADLIRRTESPRMAVDFLIDLLLGEPYDLEALLLLGRALLDDGRADEALEALAPALALFPDDLDLLMTEAETLRTLGRFGEAQAAMAGWIGDGSLSYREDIVDGFERLPEAFAGLFRGENFGRRLVRT